MCSIAPKPPIKSTGMQQELITTPQYHAMERRFFVRSFLRPFVPSSVRALVTAVSTRIEAISSATRLGGRAEESGCARVGASVLASSFATSVRPLAHLSAVLPFLSFASTAAPLPSSSCTTSVRPSRLATISAVLPCLFFWSTSAPLSSSCLTRSVSPLRHA